MRRGEKRDAPKEVMACVELISPHGMMRQRYYAVGDVEIFECLE